MQVGHAVDGGVDLHGERANHTIGNESVDATLDGRRREPDDIADVAVAGAGVLPKLVDDAVVDGVHTARLGHGLGERGERSSATSAPSKVRLTLPAAA